MKWCKLFGFVSLFIILIGCQQKELTIADKKQMVFDAGVVFVTDRYDDYLASKSEDYKNLFKQEYNKALASISYNYEEDIFSCQLVNTADYVKIVQNDTSGFQKDYENLISLELNQTSIDNYVWSYARNAVKACGTKESTFQLELDDKQQAFESNEVILDLVKGAIDDMYDASINYTTKVVDAEWVAPEDSFDVGVGRLLSVNCDGKIVNCFVVINSIKQDNEASEYVKGLSSINKDLEFPTPAYLVTYTITNLSEETVTFKDKLVTVNEEGNIITFNNEEVVGLENAKKLEPLVETTITNLYIGANSGGLLWYDSVCNNLLGVNLIQN